MVNKSPINCPKCNEYIGDEKDFMFMVTPTGGVKCPNCGTIVIESNRPIY